MKRYKATWPKVQNGGGKKVRKGEVPKAMPFYGLGVVGFWEKERGGSNCGERQQINAKREESRGNQREEKYCNIGDFAERVFLITELTPEIPYWLGEKRKGGKEKHIRLGGKEV